MRIQQLSICVYYQLHMATVLLLSPARMINKLSFNSDRLQWRIGAHRQSAKKG